MAQAHAAPHLAPILHPSRTHLAPARSTASVMLVCCCLWRHGTLLDGAGPGRAADAPAKHPHAATHPPSSCTLPSHSLAIQMVLTASAREMVVSRTRVLVRRDNGTAGTAWHQAKAPQRALCSHGLLGSFRGDSRRRCKMGARWRHASAAHELRALETHAPCGCGRARGAPRDPSAQAQCSGAVAEALTAAGGGARERLRWCQEAVSELYCRGGRIRGTRTGRWAPDRVNRCFPVPRDG